MKAPVRTALSVLGRTVWAVLVLAMGAAVVLGATRIPGEASEPVAPALALPPPAAAALVCPGPLRLATDQAGTDATYDPAFDPSPADATSDLVAVTAGTASGGAAAARLTPMAGGTSLAELAAGVEAGVLARAGGDAGLVVRADPVGDVPPQVGAGVAWRAGTGDLRGLAAASCQRPTAETWLVGGSTVLGSSARLVLQNPGATPATVSLRLWGARGPVELAGAPDYLVPPGQEETILLEGLAAEQGQMVVQVTATGGLVSAYLQDSRTDGLVAAGVDLVVGGARPATELVVPVISVTDDAPAAAALRVLAPGDLPQDGQDADDPGDDDGDGTTPGGTVHVTLLGPDGVVELPGTEDVSVDVGEVVDIPLDGLPAGDYAAWVTADLPVVAGATMSRAGTAEPGEAAPVDRAWAPAVPSRLASPLALPGDEPGRLVLATAPADGASTSRAQVVAVDAVGGVLARQDVVVGAGRTVALDLAELTSSASSDARPAALVVRSDDPWLTWGVVLDTGGSVAVLAPLPEQAVRSELAVTLR